jgi:dipeptidyl aminopeptidase/acylaminoacyl peptidase
MTLQTGARLGSYEIRGPLGAGGMGEVYRAWDARLGREVAVKVLPQSALTDPERLRRFEQEAKAAGALNHPNVLAVYDVGTHEGVPYIVSEMLEGHTLRGQIRAGGLTPRKAVEHAIQIARGLAAAHQRGIVHRDVKPENVFVTRDGHVKILDFGLAKLRDEARADPEGETATHDTRPGVILGTVPYLSPEQVRGLPADARSDVFALGAVLYEMLTRRRAFIGETASEIETAILREEPPELPAIDGRIPAALDRIARRCLEKRPEDRFESARDVAFALEAVATTTAGAPATADTGGRGRRRATLALLAAALLGAVAGAVLFANLRRPTPPPSYAQLTFRRGAILSARFAHDGQTVVYSAAWDGQPAQVFTTRIGSGETRSLDLEGVVLSVSSRDEVAVKRGRFLNRRRVGRGDPGTLARVSLAGGAPRDLLEDVTAADWDPEGRELAVVRRVEGVKRLEYPIGHVVYEGDVFGVRVLPGGRLVTTEAREGDRVGTWAFDLTLLGRAGRKTVLSPGWSEWPNLSWSEATREILFAASRADPRSIRAVGLDGRQRVLARLPGDFDLHDIGPQSRLLLERRSRAGKVLGLAPGETRERELSWLEAGAALDISADGRHVLLGDYGSDLLGVESLYIRKTDGSPAVRLGEYRGLSLSPDGRFVLALPGGQQYSDRLLVVPTGAGERRELRHASLTRIDAATWFPDGRRIAVVNRGEQRQGQLLVWDVEMSAPPRLLSAKEEIRSPVVAPDGRTVAVAVAGTGPVLCPADGGPCLPVMGGAAQDQPLRWSSDGRRLFVSRTPLFQPNTPTVWIDRIEIATGRRHPWKELRPADPAGAYAIGGVYLTPDGKSYVYAVAASLGELYLAEGLR